MCVLYTHEVYIYTGVCVCAHVCMCVLYTHRCMCVYMCGGGVYVYGGCTQVHVACWGACTQGRGRCPWVCAPLYRSLSLSMVSHRPATKRTASTPWHSCCLCSPPRPPSTGITALCSLSCGFQVLTLAQQAFLPTGLPGELLGKAEGTSTVDRGKSISRGFGADGTEAR